MGATFFENAILAENPEKAYDILTADAIDQYGGDSYNGTISTCGGYLRSKLSFDKYSKSNENKAEKYINKHMDDMGKRDCEYIDLGVVRYDIIKTSKKKVDKRKPVFKKRFVVYCESFMGNNKRKKSFDKLSEAEQVAFVQKMKYPDWDVLIKNEYVLTDGNNVVETIETTITQKKSRPKSVGKNTVVKEIHKYLFYGWVTE